MVKILRDESYRVGTVYYLFNYYSKNHYPDDAISEEDRFIRNGILNFKSGIDSENRNAVINAMVEAVMQINGINSGTVALFCVPASSQGSSALRYGELLARLRQNCPRVHFVNDQVVFTGEKQRKHLQSDRSAGSCSHFYIEGRIDEPNVVLIDDIVTQGHTLLEVSQLIDNQFGPKNYCCMTLARTVYNR